LILIISQNNEITTTEVIKWLLKLEKSFIRVHEEEIFDIKIKERRIYLESPRKSGLQPSFRKMITRLKLILGNTMMKNQIEKFLIIFRKILNKKYIS
jgi:hypothetical protein